MQCGNAEACGSMAIFMQFDSISYNLPHPLVRPWSSAGWVVQCTGTPRAVHKCIRQHAVFDNFALVGGAGAWICTYAQPCPSLGFFCLRGQRQRAVFDNLCIKVMWSRFKIVYKRSSFRVVLRLISLDHVVRFFASVQLANVETQNSKQKK